MIQLHPEPATGMQTWQGSAWGIRQHLGEASPAIPRQVQAKHPTTQTLSELKILMWQRLALGWAGVRGEPKAQKLPKPHPHRDILIYHMNKFDAEMPRAQEPIPHAAGSTANVAGTEKQSQGGNSNRTQITCYQTRRILAVSSLALTTSRLLNDAN